MVALAIPWQPAGGGSLPNASKTGQVGPSRRPKLRVSGSALVAHVAQSQAAKGSLPVPLAAFFLPSGIPSRSLASVAFGAGDSNERTFPMLVLQRKVNEGIVLEFAGETIRIELRKAIPGRAWIGISAPASVNIARDELALRDRQAAEQEGAAT